MAEEKNRHHYVPITYLRPWRASDGKGPLWISSMSPAGALQGRSGYPRSTGFEWRLYRLSERNPANRRDVNAVENWYRDVEAAAAPVRDRLLSGVVPSALTEPERLSWARFVGTLEYRAPRSIERFRAKGHGALPGLVQELWGGSLDQKHTQAVLAAIDLPSMVDDMARSAAVPHADQIADRWLQMSWALISLNEGPDFITSNYPLASVDLGDGQRLASLPLGPRHLFLAASWRDDEWEDPELAATIAATANAWQIKERPNFIYSRAPLSSDGVLDLRKLAAEHLEPLAGREG